MGLLTYDEVAFAGGKFGEGNALYYLHSGSIYILLSPVIFISGSGEHCDMASVKIDGKIENTSVQVSSDIRPVIALLSTTKYSLNDPSATPGTVDNPYIVN